MTDCETEQQTERYPSAQCMIHCTKLACTQDKPIMLDYWEESCNGNVMIGVRDNEEKLLVKSEDEYTSPISKIFRAGNEYVIITENSIYITADSISTRKIS